MLLHVPNKTEEVEERSGKIQFVFMRKREFERNIPWGCQTLSQSLNPGAARLKDFDGAIRASEDKRRKQSRQKLPYPETTTQK